MPPTTPTRGHWPKGKRRNEASAKIWGPLRARLAALLAEHPLPGVRSLRAMASRADVSDRAVRRWMADEDMPPPPAVAELRLWYHEQKRAIEAERRRSRP